LLLISCGGGGSDSKPTPTPTPTPTPNSSPTALAGDDQTVNENTLVTLTGSGTDSDGSLSSYSWSQTAGTTVTITDTATSTMSFTAPETTSSETLTFTLTVTDNYGATASDTVDVTFQHVNKPPVASALSLVSDLTTPYFQIQLIGDDADGDIVSYALESEFSGSGYSAAFIEEGKSILYLILDNSNGTNQAILSYRVTDGEVFSDEATVTIVFGEVSDSGTGANEANPEDYSKTSSAYYDGSNYSSDSGANELPDSVDLSNRMPSPGNQRLQNSCVGWAVGYALKSYQEGIEEQWPLISPNTQFSPAWIYNQINNGQDKGSLPSDALKLIVEKGAATLSTMPYSQYDFTSSPPPLAIYEASQFKAVGYQTINSIDAAKAALVNRQPIVIGLELYSSFYELSGANSVYSSVGSKEGGHAVTITGYDDNKFGGSFKVINSWGLSFGDKGYFWLPYDEVVGNVSQAYILIDGNNDGTVDETEIPLAPIRTELANLQIDSWSIAYYGQAGGDGTLQFNVTNSGGTTVPEGLNVGLFLSKDESINSSDIYVAFEEVPFEIEAGTNIYRDDTNELSFTFPDNLEAGTYYMGLLVDDINEVDESNENDNISWGNDTAVIEAINLPDLSIDNWWLNWETSGEATLEYSISNIGSASTSTIDWDVSVLIHDQINPIEGNFHFIFFETTPFILEPNTDVYRNVDNPAYLNVLTDTDDTEIPLGNYYISFYVDLLEIVEESNEYNNKSTSYTNLDIIPLTSNKGNNSATRKLKANKAFNGKRIVSSKVAMKKVEIVNNAEGQKVIKVIGDVVQTKVAAKSRKQSVELKLSVDKENNISKVLTKKIESRNKRIFPASSSKAMPKKIQ
jgi:hypothetical protein